MNVFDLFPRFAGESASAYAARHAAIGGYTSVSSFVRSLGLTYTRLVTGEELAEASAAFGDREAELRFDSGRSDAASVALRGERLSRRHWSGTKPLRFCPGCLHDDSRHGACRTPSVWHRTWWDVEALGTCAVHRVRLSRACACGGFVARNAPFDGHCPSCRVFLGDIDSEVVADACSLDGTRYVLGRLGVSGRLVSPVLDSRPLREAIPAMVAIGRMLGAEQSASALDAGYLAFERWPRGFDEALDIVAAGSFSRSGRWGAGKAYGMLHAWTVDNSDQPLAKWMARRLAAHADRNGISPGRVVRGRSCGGGDSVTLAEFSRMTGLSHAKAARLARAQPGTNIRGSGMPAAIDAAVAEGLWRSMAGSVGLSGIGAALGISRGTARDLVAAGWLMPLHDGGARTRRTFSPEAAAGLVAEASACLLSMTGEAVPLPVACRDMQVSMDRALAAVLGGSVRGVVLPGRRGLASLGVVPGDLRQPGRRVVADALTLAEVARRLNVKWEVARSLVGRGLLARDVSGLVSERSIEEFGKNFVAASDASKALRTSPRAFMARAEAGGIAPVIGPPECRKAFFERAAIENLSSRARS